MTKLSDTDGDQRDDPDERRHGLRFDKSISLGTVLTIISLITASYMSVSRIIDSIQESQVKVNIMWQQFLVDHPEAGRYWRNGGG